MLILDDLLDGLRAACGAFPDKRKGGDATYSMADIGLSAFSLFFMQSESFLSYQRSLEEGRKTSNCHTLFGMAKIPQENFSAITFVRCSTRFIPRICNPRSIKWLRRRARRAA